jgi:uncharacterized protein (DUF305 family)
VVVAAVAVAVLSACGSSDTATEATSTAPASSTSSAAAGAEAHNDADVMFAQMMIPHHQQAVEMSDMVLAKQGVDPRVVSLANAIEAAQGPEIEQMRSWLTEWDAPEEPGGMPGHDMPGHDMPGDMPQMGGHGMMSQQDMAALQNAQGVEAAKSFLSQMIAHHKGAITMAQNEIDDGQFPRAVQMAEDIKTSQQKEIADMEPLLGSL